MCRVFVIDGVGKRWAIGHIATKPGSPLCLSGIVEQWATDEATDHIEAELGWRPEIKTPHTLYNVPPPKRLRLGG